MKKRILSILLVVVILVGILPIGGFTASAETGTNEIINEKTITESGTYTLNDANISSASSPITIGENLNVTMILEGNSTLKCTTNSYGSGKADIYVPYNSSLTILGNGTLNITGGSEGAAAIGGHHGMPCGNITIGDDTNAPIIIATAGEWGPGIGDGDNAEKVTGYAASRTIAINNGTLKAYSKDGCSAIGTCDYNRGAACGLSIIIKGGTIEAYGTHGDSDGAAIGPGGKSNMAADAITINSSANVLAFARGGAYAITHNRYSNGVAPSINGSSTACILQVNEGITAGDLIKIYNSENKLERSFTMPTGCDSFAATVSGVGSYMVKRTEAEIEVGDFYVDEGLTNTDKNYVYFHPNGDNWSGDTSVKQSENTTAPTAPTKGTSTFSGWGTKSNATSVVSTFEKGKTYYAIWDLVAPTTFTANVTVTYDGEPYDQTAEFALRGNDNSNIPLVQQSDGGNFMAENLEPGTYKIEWNGVNTGVEVSADSPAAAVQLYSVKLDSNNGSDETKTVTYIKDVTQPLGENPFTRTGYTFLGWSENKDATTATYADKESITVTKPTTLYAIWDLVETPHTHTYGTTWKFDKDNHWHECTCGDKADTAKHTPKTVNKREATTTEKGYTVCEICGYEIAKGEDVPVKVIATEPTDNTPTAPPTGDSSNMFLWIALLFVSGFGLVGATVLDKKKM